MPFTLILGTLAIIHGICTHFFGTNGSGAHITLFACLSESFVRHNFFLACHTFHEMRSALIISLNYLDNAFDSNVGGRKRGRRKR